MKKFIFFYLLICNVPYANAINDFSHFNRVALVIGNSNYSSGKLKNPVNDARLIAETLEDLGFKTILDVNLKSRYEMVDSLRNFRSKIKENTVALFYFAGHGVQVNDQNFLLPVNSNIECEDDVEFEAISAREVVKTMKNSNSPVNIVILDACRDNPLKNSCKRNRVKRGLAEMPGVSGVKILFSTKPGGVAFDGNREKNSPFTKNLSEQMKVPGQDLENMIQSVAQSVNLETQGEQTPWEEGMILGKFYFVPEQKKGTLIVGLTPEVREATIWLNGKSFGHMREIPISHESKYLIEARANGYYSARVVLNLKPNESSEVTLAMEKRGISAHNESPPSKLEYMLIQRVVADKANELNDLIDQDIQPNHFGFGVPPEDKLRLFFQIIEKCDAVHQLMENNSSIYKVTHQEKGRVQKLKNHYGERASDLINKSINLFYDQFRLYAMELNIEQEEKGVRKKLLKLKSDVKEFVALKSFFPEKSDIQIELLLELEDSVLQLLEKLASNKLK